jgi:hypothetical protein
MDLERLENLQHLALLENLADLEVLLCFVCHLSKHHWLQ